MLCGAAPRHGLRSVPRGRCRRPARANGRCYLHGGCSTGPGAAMDWRPGIEAALLAKRKWLADLHALGLKHPGGRPARRWRKLDGASRKEVLQRMADVIENLPVGPVDKPVERWSHTELLSDAARLGLIRWREIMQWECSLRPETDHDVKIANLVERAANNAARVLSTVQAAAMQTSADKDLYELIARIAEHKENSKENQLHAPSGKKSSRSTCRSNS